MVSLHFVTVLHVIMYEVHYPIIIAIVVINATCQIACKAEFLFVVFSIATLGQQLKSLTEHAAT